MRAATPTCCLLLVLLGCAAGSPILGVPAYTVLKADGSGAADAPADADDFAHLVVTTGSPRAVRPTAASGPSDDVVPLATSKDRSRFLATLLMLESLHDKPVADARLRKEILADEDLMQEVLKLYETTQETKGQHFIKIPPKLMKKMKTKMAELLSE